MCTYEPYLWGICTLVKVLGCGLYQYHWKQCDYYLHESISLRMKIVVYHRWPRQTRGSHAYSPKHSNGIKNVRIDLHHLWRSTFRHSLVNSDGSLPKNCVARPLVAHGYNCCHVICVMHVPTMRTIPFCSDSFHKRLDGMSQFVMKLKCHTFVTVNGLITQTTSG